MESIDLDRKSANEPPWVGLIDKITRVGAVIVGLVTLMLLLTIVVDVVMRNVFAAPLPGALSTTIYWWMPIIGVFGLGYVHLRNEQIVMTLLAENASARALKPLGVSVEIVVAALIILLLVLSWESAMQHFGYQTAAPDQKWLPIWPGRFALVAGLAIVLLAVPARIYRILAGTTTLVPDEISEAVE
jgi:TRAP-type C4-dicarboxylate transport system permease small subunit